MTEILTSTWGPIIFALMLVFAYGWPFEPPGV